LVWLQCLGEIRFHVRHELEQLRDLLIITSSGM
jgi:hypothetical protein